MTAEFHNAIFAGGGSRCFWQLGFWDGANAAGLPLQQTVRFAGSTSAGCALATAAMLDRGREALDLFMELTARNPRNIHWQNLRPGSGAPLLPHIHMYREALETFLSDADLQDLDGRQVSFLMSQLPRFFPGALGVAAAFAVYGLEKHLTGKLHPNWTAKMGFSPLVAGNREAENVEEFIGMILSASCVPPVLPGGAYRGRRVLDGGLIDNVPVQLADGREGRTLVLLSKRYPRPLPIANDRVYVQPSRPISLDKFDYANPQGLQETYELGREDGSGFAEHTRA